MILLVCFCGIRSSSSRAMMGTPSIPLSTLAKLPFLESSAGWPRWFLANISTTLRMFRISWHSRTSTSSTLFPKWFLLLVRISLLQFSLLSVTNIDTLLTLVWWSLFQERPTMMPWTFLKKKKKCLRNKNTGEKGQSEKKQKILFAQFNKWSSFCLRWKNLWGYKKFHHWKKKNSIKL